MTYPVSDPSQPGVHCASLNDLMHLDFDALWAKIEALGIELPGHTNRTEAVLRILQHQAPSNSALQGCGVLDIPAAGTGFGFLRHASNDFLPGPLDIYVSANQIRRLGLRTGQEVAGIVRPPKNGEHYLALLTVQQINGQPVEQIRRRRDFYDLTPVFPDKRLLLETEPGEWGPRIVDLIAPIGKGQRALIVSPPKAGKTVLLQQIARALARNHPDVHVLVLLVDERPAEVTEFERTVAGEVLASTFDEEPARHCHVAEMALERARRLVEAGRDVVVLLDSITRLARAYNTLTNTGKIMTGGVDVAALQKPKRIFGAARNTVDAGSLTILGTALVDTGSRMDDVIYEEFKGTGDCEIHLDRRLANRRLFPAIDVNLSGTRKEELLLHPEEERRIHLLRKYLQDLNIIESAEFLVEKLKANKTNAEFLMSMKLP